MAAVYKPKYTKPLPENAELFTRNGERWARWTDRRGRKQTAKVTAGRDGSPRIVRECRTYTAKYRNGANRVPAVATGCRSKDAAERVLGELVGRADKVRSGAWTAAEDSVLDWQATPIAQHVGDYLDGLRSKRNKASGRRVSPAHVANVTRCLNRIISECGFKRLGDLNRPTVERWADRAENDGMAARTINTHLAAMAAFGNWAAEAGRIVANPLARPPKRDEKADRRRTRRALTADELRRLLFVARWRLVAEYGRETVKLADADKPDDPKSRATWRKARLTADGFDGALRRGRKVLAERPAYLAKLESRGRERALIYKVLTLTGLRKGELAALTLGAVELEETVPHIVLNAADEKAGRGAELPLRADLAGDLRAWLSERLTAAQNHARAEGKPIPARLASVEPLFNVPADLIRQFDRDLLAAGIARLVTDADGNQRIDKSDERGRTLDIHALRHTFGTHLSKGGVAPADRTSRDATQRARAHNGRLHRSEVARRGRCVERIARPSAGRSAGRGTAKSDRNRRSKACTNACTKCGQLLRFGGIRWHFGELRRNGGNFANVLS